MSVPHSFLLHLQVKHKSCWRLPSFICDSKVGMWRGRIVNKNKLRTVTERFNIVLKCSQRGLLFFLNIFSGNLISLMEILMLKVVFIKNWGLRWPRVVLLWCSLLSFSICVYLAHNTRHRCPPSITYTALASLVLGVMGKALSRESASVLNQWMGGKKSAHKSSIISRAARQNINTARIASTTSGIA